MSETVNSRGFVHLRVRSAYSLLEGAIKAAKVGKLAADAGMPAVGVADRANLFGALDRAIPGLGKVIKQNANAGISAGINSLGTEATLEGKKARSFPLRFADGAVFLGPLKVAQIPPLF